MKTKNKIPLISRKIKVASLFSDVQKVMRGNLHLAVHLIVIFGSSILILIVMYSQFRDGIYAQDDPVTIGELTNDDLSVFERIFMSNWNRFRPVTNLIEFPIVNLVRDSYELWLLASLIIFASFITYLGYLFHAINKSLYIGVILVLLVLTSRFNTGIILNLTFMLETISIVILLALLMKFFQNWDRTTFTDLKISVFLYGAIVLTHERYVGLNLFFLIYFMAHKNFSMKSKFIYFSLFSIPTASLFLVKQFLLEIPIFVGTGSVNEVGFDLKSAFIFLGMLVLGVFGINFGYEYLHGHIYQNQTLLFQSISTSILVLTLGILLIALFSRFDKENLDLKGLGRVMLVVFALFASLVIPVISTIRIEHRWYLPIYIIFLFLLLHRISDKKVHLVKKPSAGFFEKTLLLLFLIANLFMNFNYIERTDGLYFINTQKALKIQITSLEKSISFEQFPDRTIYLLDPRNQINLELLNLGIDANLEYPNLDVVRILEVNEVTNLQDFLVLELDPNKPLGNFRPLNN